MYNRSLYLEVANGGIPKFHPQSMDYKKWWKEQIHRCKYGYSVGGKWMPGRLYFYVNFWHIEIKKGNSKRASLGLPELRDVEWEIALAIENARGFSGIDSNGIPQYNNPAKGLMLITGRGVGKSFSVAGMGGGYEYTFFPSNEIVVSAEETRFSIPHMQKIKMGLENLKGSVTVGQNSYPSPLVHRRLKNRWDEEVKSGYHTYEGGIKKEKGFNSRIYHRVYKDNPTASNGLRPSFHIFEEVGMFGNLKSSYMASWECWMNGPLQFGSPILIGTGGDMDRGTIDASEMFYDPDGYNLLAFEDTFEQKGKICKFIPATMGDNESKDENGETIYSKALQKIEEKREKKKMAKDRSVYYGELQNQPLVPSEAFLINTSNIFPIADLQEHLRFITNNKEIENAGRNGDLVFNKDGEVTFVPSPNKYPADFRSKIDDAEGCIVIWEPPDEGAPYGTYISGIDPYMHDNSTETYPSLGSCFIYKRFYKIGATYDMVVAEYTGRPKTQEEWYENIRKLLLYYNAQALYENQIIGLKQYFDKKNCLYLLYPQPTYYKNIITTSQIDRQYGVPMNRQFKEFGERLINQWLLEEFEPGKLNLTKLLSVPLLKELIQYNHNDNFDRVISFMLVLFLKEAVHKEVLETKEIQVDTFFNKKLFSKI